MRAVPLAIPVTMACTGAFLLNSSMKNRSPMAVVKSLVADPSHASANLKALEGTWTGGGTPMAYARGPSLATAQSLVALSWNPLRRLSPGAAASLEKLNTLYRSQKGSNLPLSSAYRTYAQQVKLKETKGAGAATPGTSKHELGTAVDFTLSTYTGALYKWLAANAPAYGWHNPAWAAQGGNGSHEPWHWEWGG